MYGIGNLTGLSKIGSNRDVINYISLLTTVLNRLSLDPESSVELLTLTHTALISATCQLPITDKVLTRQRFCNWHLQKKKKNFNSMFLFFLGRFIWNNLQAYWFDKNLYSSEYNPSLDLISVFFIMFYTFC